MNITVHSRSGRVSESLEKFATEKMAHLVKFLPTIDSIYVELYEDGKPTDVSGHVAHVTVTTSGPCFRSKVTSGDPRTCIDIACDRLYRRIREFKRRRSSKPAHARTGRQALKGVPANEKVELGLPADLEPRSGSRPKDNESPI
ncbi:MAG: HPF/RaiA family ribosome-associated protein [Actinomycetota bacterium]|nr:HPF/RaiA family ribosome-associated protein [Actinomycetota bacterium]